MAHATVTVATEVLETRAGLWCRECGLPSALSLTIAMTIGVGGTPRLSTLTRCRDCGGDEIDV